MSKAGRPAITPAALFAAIVLVAVLSRLAVMLPGRGAMPDDPDNYLPLARALAGGEGLSFNGRPTAYRPPLYPILLAPLTMLPEALQGWGIRGLHLVLGAGTAALTMLAAGRWGLATWQIALAGTIVALDPVLVAQARAVMTETFAALLIALALAVLAGRGTARPAIAGGLALGLAALCRPSLLPIAGLAALGAAVLPPDPARARVGRAALLILAVVATLSPWAIRNARIFGEPVWTTTHGGYTLALANNALYYENVLDGPPGAVWSGPSQQTWFASVNRRTAGLTEPRADRLLRNEALDMLRTRPRDFARASLARLGRFWSVAPSRNVYPAPLRIATALWTVPLWIALAVGLTQSSLWRWPRVAAPAVLLALTFVHAVYWTDARMRAPIIPAIALVAGAAFSTKRPIWK